MRQKIRAVVRPLQQDLHGDVIAVGYSWAVQEPEGLTKDQLTGLVERQGD